MNKIEAHEYSSYHRSLIERSSKVGCFYCKRIYHPGRIYEWIDGGQTALCAKCGIDSVLPNFWGMCSEEFLKEMNEYWFDYSNSPEYKMCDGKPVAVKDPGQQEFRPITEEELVRFGYGRDQHE